MAKDHDELEGISLGNADPGEIEIYTPAEMTVLLVKAGPERVPFQAISGLPAQIFLGQLSGAALAQALLLQLFWCIVMVAAGMLLLRVADGSVWEMFLVEELSDERCTRIAGSFGELGLVLDTFQPETPLVVELLRLAFRLADDRESHLDLGWLDR